MATDGLMSLHARSILSRLDSTDDATTDATIFCRILCLVFYKMQSFPLLR